MQNENKQLKPDHDRPDVCDGQGKRHGLGRIGNPMPESSSPRPSPRRRGGLCTPRRTAIAILSGVVLLPGIIGCNRGQQQPPAAQPPEVIVGKPEMQTVTNFEEFTGHTEAKNSIVVRAMVSGYLEKVYFKEGTDVKENAPLFLIDPKIFQAQFDQADANLLLAKAHLKRLEADYKRAESLLPSRAISQEDFDKVDGDRNEAAAAVKVAENARNVAKQNLDYTKISATIDGRVSRQMIDPGNMVKANDTPLTSIVSLDKIYVYFDIDERAAIRINRLIDDGKIDKSAIKVDFGLADEQGFPHEAIINFFDNQIDPATGTLRLRAVIDNPRHFLMPNMYLRVRLPIGKPYDVLMVPERALGSDQGQKFLFLVDGDNKAVYQQVQCGPLRNGMRAILSGLKSTDRFVVTGLQRIRPGDEVAPKEEEKKKETAAVAEIAKPQATVAVQK
jgi:RND family efflux transporter MFP subunit